MADGTVQQDAALARLEHAERLLAEVATAEQAVGLARFAEAARVYARQAQLSVESINHATTIKVLAERRMAECVDAGQAAKEIATQGKPSESEGLVTLRDIGISNPARLAEARDLRDRFTEDEIRQRAAKATASEKALSRDRLLREARDRKAQEMRDEKARRTAEARQLPPDFDLRHGDFREVLASVPANSIDAIITDPPYPAEFLPLFEELAIFANRVLSDGGVLAVMSGQAHLPTVYELLSGYRPYRWTMAYLTPGSGYASHASRVQSNWKPILVYGGGPRFGDVVTSAGESKHLHEWGQDVGGFAELVERLTEPGAVVCDPFMGAGTTALAALSLGRKFIGCDIDEHSVQRTGARLVSGAA